MVMVWMLSCCSIEWMQKGLQWMILQPVREAVSYRGLFTAGWFGVREKHCSWLEIYDRLRASLRMLTACRHAGLVSEGLEIFHRMKKDFGIDPKIEHFGALVHLLVV